MMIALLNLGLALAQEGPESGSGSGSSPPAPPTEEAPADDSARDQDIFGPPAGPPPVEAAPVEEPPVPALEPTPLDAAIRSDATIGDQLAAKDERLTFGGQLYLRVDSITPREPEGLDDVDLASPNLFDLFADVRPNDRLRGYAQGRLTHDWTVRTGDLDAYGVEVEPTTVLLDQLWLKGDIARKVFVTAGRQRIKWGAGRFWNPTDFLNTSKLDALAVFDERTGVSLLKLHVPIGNWNAYAIADLEDGRALEEVGGAARLEALVGSTEISASAALRKDEPLKLGADLSTGVWLLDLRLEGAVLHGDGLHGWEGTLDLETFSSFPTQVDRSDDWIPQVTAGGEITFKLGDEDTLTWGVEGFWNDLGVDDAGLYPWLILEGDFTPFYLGRLYGGTYVYLPAPGQWDDVSFTASALANLSDETGVARLDWSWVVLTELRLNVYGQAHLGEQGEFAFSVDVPAVPGIEGLEDGISVAAPMLDVGVGARVEF